MDEKRINKVQSLIESSTDVERKVMPIMNKCIDGMAAAAQMIDCRQVRTVNVQVRVINRQVKLSPGPCYEQVHRWHGGSRPDD